MPAAPAALEQLELLIGKITGEALLANVGSDEGMIPIYALLSDIRTLCEEQPGFVDMLESVRQVKALLDNLLDTAQPFEADSLGYVRDFTAWATGALNIFSGGGGCPPFPAFNAAVDANLTVASDDDDDAPPAKAPAKDEHEEETILALNLTDDPELLREFHTEALEHLEAIEAHVLVLESEPKNTEGLAAVFRAFHTIKGVAGFLHLLPIQELAHEVESLLDLARNDQITLDSSMITLILRARDTLARLADQVAHGLETGQQPAEIVPVRGLIHQVYEASQRAVHGGPALETEPEEAAPRPLTPADVPADPAAAHQAGRQAATIRVDAEKVANLMDTVGELVIVESQIAESAAISGRADTALQRNLALLNRITKDLQHTSMALRMVPIKPTFQKVGRLVRDLAKTLQKEIDFEVSGEETELDRNMVESIGDPLIHMVRNAIDHGLEPTAEARVAAGKPSAGKIRLRAYQMGSQIVIEMSDDGRGINADKVLRKAREKGLVDANRDLTREEVYQLIFLPGFSTADAVTDISGRGVGMDVVRRNIEAMRGEVVVESVPGHGTTFKIKLPLTAAIIEGLVVRVGIERFVVPTNSVKVILRPQARELARITGQAEVLLLRDQTVPLIRLHKEFQIPNALMDPTRASVVVIDSFGRHYALLVDEMINKQEVVIKNLGHIMRNVPGVAGGAILGDGTIALILDTASLLGKSLNVNN